MEFLIKKKDFHLPENPYSILYEIDTFRYIKSPEDPVENRIQLKVKKSFIRKDNFGYLFSVETIEKKQSNKEDSLNIDYQISNLQNKLILYTNEQGDIISIVNRGQISELWYDKKKEFKKEFKDDIEDIDEFIKGVDAIIKNHKEFLNLVKKSEVATLLFPPIYNCNLLVENAIKQEKIFYDFFDTNALPFRIETKTTALNTETKGYQVIRAGDLNTPKFNNESAAALISNLFEVHTYNIKIEANYFEALDLSEDDIIEEASFLLNVEIPGIYSYRQISKLKAM